LDKNGDGDYDYDRYDRDSDYADGVDDAMDEFGEDWSSGGVTMDEMYFTIAGCTHNIHMQASVIEYS